MELLQIYQACRQCSNAHAWAERLFAEIDYCLQLDRVAARPVGDCVAKAIYCLYRDRLENGTVTVKACKRAEKLLIPYAAEAKSKTAICVAHAHIDMNWLWGYDETVAITVSTVETMLRLLDTYPKFTFSQSQASVYAILEEFRPDLLKRVKSYVRKNRWEVTAGAWVECDKNMPSGDSMRAQIEETRSYLSELLGIDPASVDFDFEPDTFGHGVATPAILARCGIRYYYHCRGNDAPPLYYWEAETGERLLVYREPHWYNAAITAGDFDFVPDFCAANGVDQVLKVYGVGDHGGGATVRDIERLTRMSEYPVFPTIRFGRYRDFFAHVESKHLPLPVVRGEQNPIFTGCYTSQSLLKTANAECERALCRAELFAAVAPPPFAYRHALTKARRNVLFNQFHDILPGSGKESTRVCALGRAQDALAATGTVADAAIRNFIKEVDYSCFFGVSFADADTATGAGGGYRAGDNLFTHAAAGGPERAYTVFNPLCRARKACVPLEIWDYAGDVGALAAFAADGARLPFRITDASDQVYWSHNVRHGEIELDLPPFGYRSFVLKPAPAAVPVIEYPPLFERTEQPDHFVFDNGRVHAEFDGNCRLARLRGRDGKEYLSTPAAFTLGYEDGVKTMSAWTVGRIGERGELHRRVNVLRFERTPLRTTLVYRDRFGDSSMTVTATLAACEDVLDLSVVCDFRERGEFAERVPQLAYVVPVADAPSEAVYAAAYGIIRRPAANQDVCSQGMCLLEGDRNLLVMSPNKYGFRYWNQTVTVDCLRASFDPDPTPEYGERSFRIGLRPDAGSPNEALSALLGYAMPPFAISAEAHAGARAPDGVFFNCETDGVVTSVRREETLRCTVVNADDAPRTCTVSGKTIPLPARDFVVYEENADETD